MARRFCVGARRAAPGLRRRRGGSPRWVGHLALCVKQAEWRQRPRSLGRLCLTDPVGRPGQACMTRTGRARPTPTGRGLCPADPRRGGTQAPRTSAAMRHHPDAQGRNGSRRPDPDGSRTRGPYTAAVGPYPGCEGPAPGCLAWWYWCGPRSCVGARRASSGRPHGGSHSGHRDGGAACTGPSTTCSAACAWCVYRGGNARPSSPDGSGTPELGGSRTCDPLQNGGCARCGSQARHILGGGAVCLAIAAPEGVGGTTVSAPAQRSWWLLPFRDSPSRPERVHCPPQELRLACRDIPE